MQECTQHAEQRYQRYAETTRPERAAKERKAGEGREQEERRLRIKNLLVKGMSGAHSPQGLPVNPFVVPIAVKEEAKVVQAHASCEEEQRQCCCPKEYRLPTETMDMCRLACRFTICIRAEIADGINSLCRPSFTTFS